MNLYSALVDRSSTLVINIFIFLVFLYFVLLILFVQAFIWIVRLSPEQIEACHQSSAAKKDRGKLSHFRVLHFFTIVDQDVSFGRFMGSQKAFNCRCTFLASARNHILPYHSIQQLVFLHSHSRMKFTDGVQWMCIESEKPICPECNDEFMNLDELVKMLDSLDTPILLVVTGCRRGAGGFSSPRSTKRVSVLFVVEKCEELSTIEEVVQVLDGTPSNTEEAGHFFCQV